MNNNKMNLLPNSKHFDNNGKPKNKNPKPNVENFPMRIPDEEDNKTNESDAPEQIDQSVDANNNEEENAEELTKDGIEPHENKQAKPPFFSKFKNIFSNKT